MTADELLTRASALVGVPLRWTAATVNSIDVVYVHATGCIVAFDANLLDRLGEAAPFEIAHVVRLHLVPPENRPTYCPRSTENALPSDC